ncbi:hypothetical protein Acr_23g0021800 [Actinidia rufa]|uniref:Uncharacterized protein n=1 Tax=Actinidia rufa TaxID=165716 RepID=A0A7J0GSI1_9ERIC|nr:hypothetical protein Acr_23g0021800 [Actinidia rufa]
MGEELEEAVRGWGYGLEVEDADSLGLKKGLLRTYKVCIEKELEDYVMEVQTCETVSPQPRVKATIRLGSETYSVQANTGILSEQLASMKEESMSMLKDFITKHNVPNDVPDETDDISSEDDDEAPEKVPVKSKKQRK